MHPQILKRIELYREHGVELTPKMMQAFELQSQMLSLPYASPRWMELYHQSLQDQETLDAMEAVEEAIDCLNDIIIK